MTPMEYAGWQQHLVRYPPLEYILSRLWLTVSRALGNDKARPEDMGYWIESPKMRQQRMEEKEQAQLRAEAQQVAQAYRRKKGHG